LPKYCMSKDKVIELATYIVVALAMWVVSPLLGKFIDSFYFHYPNVLADSISITLFGACVVLLGTILVAWTVFLFKTKGQGTPNPKLPPKAFVVSGPYRLSRNPMALGGLLTLLGEAIVYILALLIGICHFVWCNRLLPCEVCRRARIEGAFWRAI